MKDLSFESKLFLALSMVFATFAMILDFISKIQTAFSSTMFSYAHNILLLSVFSILVGIGIAELLKKYRRKKDLSIKSYLVCAIMYFILGILYSLYEGIETKICGVILIPISFATIFSIIVDMMWIKREKGEVK